jgi:hypothetical protein
VVTFDYDQSAIDTLRRGMLGDDGLVHAADKMTAEHVHAGWWMSACRISVTKHHNARRWTEAPTTCLECATSRRNARLHR